MKKVENYKKICKKGIYKQKNMCYNSSESKNNKEKLMAEKKKIDLSTVEFNEDKSNIAKNLNALSGEEIFNRYFYEDDQDQDILDSFNASLAQDDPKRPGKTKFEILRSFITNNTLNTICNAIESFVTPYVPEGYSFDTNKLCEDLEAAFTENMDISRNAALRNTKKDKVHPFVVGIINYFQRTVNRGIEYKHENTDEL